MFLRGVSIQVLGAVLLLGSGVFDAVSQEFQDAEKEAPESLGERPRVFDDVIIEEGVPEAGFLIPGLKRSFPGLEPVLRDSEIRFEPRSYYFYRSFSDGRAAEAWTVGGALTYESGWIGDTLKLGAVAYTSQRIYGPPDRDGTGLLQRQQQPYTTLGQLYLQAKVGESTATLYRQELNVPYVNRNDSRMTPRTFEGYTVTSEEIENLQMIVGHLTGMKDRTRTSFDPMSVAAGAPGSNQGVTMGGFVYQFTEGFRAGAINHYGWDTLNLLYTGASLDHTTDQDVDLSLGFQFSDQSSVGDALAGSRSGQLYGVEASAGVNSLIASVAFTQRTGDRITKPWGGDPSYNSLMLSDYDRRSEEAIRLGLSYDFEEIGLPGVSAFANYAWGNTPETGPDASPDQQEVNVTLDLRPEKGKWKDFWLRFRYGYNDRDGGGVSRTDFRVIANYSIEF